ncbi:hypothetical protein CASFOL_004557 [Castilleja foliolosa]|uniref:BZIP domain-containing protein n=1 Tax=Castilleja foliolosa TaxID=1961234 RepID=A0ABD3EAS8_9LAMI
MENSKGSSNSIRSTMHNGKNSLLPPKIPYPSIAPSYTEFIPRSGPRPLPKPRNGNPHHQRTSSESLLDEQPSWLDELLDEPDTPVRKGGHRRSSSDSFAYTDNYNVAPDYDNKLKNITTPLSSSWGSQDIDFYRDTNRCGKIMNKPWDSPLSLISPPHGFNSYRDNGICLNSGSVGPGQDADRNLSYSDVESGPHDPKGSFDKKDYFHETDTKRSKQQYAQRSRVRKLQYIAELERNVQALQAEGSEASAELEFLNNQNLILSLENKALLQRLESLSQEQLIKYFEQEVLEREAVRLRSLYQQQQQQPPQQQLSSGHRRAKSRDLDQQFANLSLKQKETSAGGQDSISSQLHI